MRSKIVMLTLVVAVGLVALAVVLRGVMAGRGPVVDTAPPPGPETPVATNVQSLPVNPNSSNTAAVVEQLHAAEVAKELEQVLQLQAQGPTSPDTISLLLSKLTHQEPEVRKAALEALVQLNATNAIPGLEEALKLTEDPREKVALMEAINYLKLPDNTPEDVYGPPPPAGSGAEAMNLQGRPPDLKNLRSARGKKGRPAANPRAPAAAPPTGAPAAPDQTQPASPAQAAPQAQ
jgi:hypothetical protein